MLSKIWNFKFKFCIAFLFWIIACKNVTPQIKEKTNETHKSLSNSVDSVITTLVNSEYKLTMNTSFSNDTTDVVDYKENIYSSPIILNQNLFFFSKDRLVKIYRIPIDYVMKKTTVKTNLKALQTPIYQICLTKTDKGTYYYVVNGSDYCNGSDCPEFIGIYSMLGKIVYEGLSNTKEKISLRETLSKYEIELRNQDRCVQVDLFK